MALLPELEEELSDLRPGPGLDGDGKVVTPVIVTR